MYFCKNVKVVIMGTIVLKVKSEKDAHMLADFLQTIDYIDGIEHQDDNAHPPKPVLL